MAAQANPHKRLRSLYGARMMTQYRGIPLGELSPHAYAIAEQVKMSAPSTPCCARKFPRTLCHVYLRRLR